jgi:hypothetical protein
LKKKSGLVKKGSKTRSIKIFFRGFYHLTFTASAVEADGTGSGSDIYLPTVTLAYTE